MAEETAKRNRKANFTTGECAVILEEAEKNLNVIKSKFSNVLTNKKKNEVWENIKQKVNALGVCVRSVQEVKDRWRGMVSSAKKEHCKIGKERKMTGGGRKPDSPNASTQKIINLFGEDPSFSGIASGYDTGEVATIALDQETTASGLETLDVSQIDMATEIPEIIEIPVKQDASPGEDYFAVIEPKTKRQKVTMDTINQAHLEVINLEKEKLKQEIENALLIKRNLQLEIEALELRNGKFLHES